MALNISIEDYEKIAPVASIKTSSGIIKFHVPNKMAMWRVKTLFTKEPDTIAWINNFEEKSEFVDIGANMGIYTIWAAMTKNVQVRAFEPESENFCLLQKNIVLNDLFSNIIAWPVAIFNESKYSTLYLSSNTAAGSCHNFDQSVDFHLKPQERPIKQGSVSITLDQLINENVINVPDYMKIDVDGLEHLVLEGAEKTLKNKKLKSVLTELNWNLDIHKDIIHFMEQHGFFYNKNQVEKSKEKEGPFVNIGNCIFHRK